MTSDELRMPDSKEPMADASAIRHSAFVISQEPAPALDLAGVTVVAYNPEFAQSYRPLRCLEQASAKRLHAR